MPVSSAMDGNFPITLQYDLGSIDFQINNFYANGYHPFKGCYPSGLKTSCNGNLISERLYAKLQFHIRVTGFRHLPAGIQLPWMAITKHTIDL